MFTGISGEYRVKNVKVGGEPIDPGRSYIVAGTDYFLLDNGDGHTSFNDAELIADDIVIDNMTLIGYITDTLEGAVGEGYEDPYGQGRIVIIGN